MERCFVSTLWRDSTERMRCNDRLWITRLGADAGGLLPNTRQDVIKRRFSRLQTQGLGGTEDVE